MEHLITPPSSLTAKSDLRIVVVKMGIIVMAMVPLGIEDKAKEILEAHSMVKVEDEVNLIEDLILVPKSSE